MRRLFRRRSVDADLSEELQAHLDLLTDRYVEQGMSRDEARMAATRQLGNVTRVREDLHEMNGIHVVDNLSRDLSFAIRQIVRNPLFALVVIITMALGIGANTAILSVAYSVLLKPLPYTNPGEIYSTEIIVPERRAQIPSLPATVQVFLAWQRSQTTLTALTALTPWEASMTGDGEPERLGAARVATNFFTFLGAPIERGRAFADEESQPGKDRVVVISHSLWQRRYGSDEHIIGRTVSINGEPFQIIGVAAPTLIVPTRGQVNSVITFAPRIDVWKPDAPTPQTLNNESWDHGVLVRLPDPRQRARAEQELASILLELAKVQMPGVKTDAFVQLTPMRDLYASKVRRPLLIVVGAAVLLLATACASIANILLSRGASRSTEIAMRLALGASRARIAGQMIVETMVLALLGGAAGTLLAFYGTSLLITAAPEDVQALSTASLNLPMLLSALAVTVLTGLICGVVPVLQGSRRDPVTELKDAARVTPSRMSRVRQTLVSVEMALATLLLASGALLLHSFVNIINADRGYDVEGVLTVDLSLFGDRYKSPQARGAFYDDLLGRVRALPGVISAGAINDLPAVSASDGPSRAILLPEDTDFAKVVLLRPIAMIRAVTTGYFAASGSRMIAGRPFNEQEGKLVGIVSESLMARLWPGVAASDIVGKQVRQGGNTSGPLIEIVGVAVEAQPGGVDVEPTAALYRPYAQWVSGPMTLIVRTAQDPALSAASIKTEIRRLDSDLPIMAMRTMREVVSSTVSQRRFQMLLVSLFAAVALLLGVVGVYGVTNYAVVCRTKDIGVRLALGAPRGAVMRWAVAVGMWPVMIGLVTGFAGAAAAANVFRATLFGITPLDPLSFAGVGIILLAAAGLACYLPARRAGSVDPVLALRHE